MQRPNLLLCIVAFLGLIICQNNGAQQPSQYQIQWSKIAILVHALNQLYLENGYSTRAILPIDSNPAPFFRQLNKCQAWAFGDTRTFGIDFKENSDVVLDFTNWPASDSIEGADAILYTRRPVPKWSEERVAKLAEKCALIFFPEMAKTAKFDYAMFSTDYTSGPYFNDGQWIVVFRRFSNEGYPFKSDFINIRIGERTGPLAGVMRIPSYFPEIAHHPMSKQQAILAAASAFGQFRKTQVALSIIEQTTIVKSIGQPKLEIVNPLDGNASTLEDYIHSQGINAKLAWVSRYLLVTPVHSGLGGGKASQKQRLDIFVDAENGQFLGVDF